MAATPAPVQSLLTTFMPPLSLTKGNNNIHVIFIRIRHFTRFYSFSRKNLTIGSVASDIGGNVSARKIEAEGISMSCVHSVLELLG